jgi:TatD DNase family protein
MDVHTHIVEDPEQLEKLDSIDTQTLFLMSTHKKEWDIVKAYKYPKVPCFGIHPWFAHHHTENDIDELEKLLIEYPDALVGEIGVDKVAKSPEGMVYDFQIQKQFFEKQMHIAAVLDRPVSIHSVQSHGYILDYFRQVDQQIRRNKKTGLDTSLCPPSIMLHSFSASSQISDALVKLPSIGSRFYFSFSHLVNSRSPKCLERIKAIPEDRILLESDVHSTLAVDEAMNQIIDLVSLARSWTRDYTIERTVQNTMRFLRRL